MTITWTIDGMSADQRSATRHATDLTARVTMPDGTTEMLTIDGFGCSVALCSKAFIRAKADRSSAETIWIDTIGEIKDIAHDGALFVMKDGTARRLSFVSDFRVIYVRGPNSKTKKLDLSKVRSLQIIASK
jgi:hypothetical protein